MGSITLYIGFKQSEKVLKVDTNSNEVTLFFETIAQNEGIKFITIGRCIINLDNVDYFESFSHP